MRDLRLEKEKMLKIERDKLLMAVVLILVISMDILNTSMLASLLPCIPNVIPFLGVRFFYIKRVLFDFSHLCASLVSGRMYDLL